MSQFTKHTSGPVDPSNPWSDDVLKRRELAQQLTAALSTVTQPFVLGLHGEFGNGKTFFIKRWQQELQNAGDVAVYFNAWETDYAADPLIAFTAVIKKQLEAQDLIGGKEAAKALATSAGRIVLGSVLPRAVSLATAGIIQASDISALVGLADDVAGAASDITDQAIEKAIRRHEEARDEVGPFARLWPAARRSSPSATKVKPVGSSSSWTNLTDAVRTTQCACSNASSISSPLIMLSL